VGELNTESLRNLHSFALFCTKYEGCVLLRKINKDMHKMPQVSKNLVGSGQSQIFWTLDSSSMHPSNVHLCLMMVAVGATKINLDADTVVPTFSKCCRMWLIMIQCSHMKQHIPGLLGVVL
jgi:hypothetical protein